jgi:Ca-activated chloride channel homolog
MKIEAALTYDKIRHDQDHNAHLVISLTAPTKDGEEGRAPICVVPVVDISGSMAGAKLDYAKRSAIKLIEHLKPGDYTGLIAFESRVHVIIAPQKITPEVKEQMKAEIGKLHTIGGTNFAGGMLKAIEMVNALDLPSGVIHRIIMLTDGQANEGPATKKDDLIKLFTANSGRVTASAFGYGSGGGIDQELLAEFARDCKGNYAYIRDPDGALTAFGKELGGLISTYGTELVLELSPLAGHEIASVVSDVDADEEAVGGEVTINLPEILAEERRDLVLAVKLKAQKQAFPRAVNVFDVKLTYGTIAADGKTEKKTAEAKAKAQFVKPGEENPKPNPDLDKIVALAEVIRAQIEAEEKAKKGDFTAAAAVMHNAAHNVGARGHERLAAAASHTSGSVGSHAAYADNQGYLQSFRYGGTRGMGVSEIDEGAAMFLADAGVQLSNSSQATTSASFTGGGTVMPVQHAGDYASMLGGAAAPVLPSLVGSVIPNVGLGSAIVGVGDLSIASGAVWVAPQPGNAAGIMAQPPVPQTNNPALNGDRDKKRDKAKAGKIKKSKSSARW